jgi:hypothetical protein
MNLKSKKKKTYNDDDGRVIANMDFEYEPGLKWFAPLKRERPKAEKESEKKNEVDMNPQPPLSRKETFIIMRSALLAGLVIGTVFILIYFLVILFFYLLWS